MALTLLTKVKSKIGISRKNEHDPATPLSPSLPTSAQSVLNTYELLENILSYLDVKSLRKAQAVCTAWNDLILRCGHLAATRRVDSKENPRDVRLLLIGAPHNGKKSLTLKWTSSLFLDALPSDSDDTYILHKTLSLPYTTDTSTSYDNDTFATKLITVDCTHSPSNSTSNLTSSAHQQQPILNSTRHRPTYWSYVVNYLRHADAYALVYSVSDRESFSRLKTLAADISAVVDAFSSPSSAAVYPGTVADVPISAAQVPYPPPGRRPALNRPVGLVATKCDFESLLGTQRVAGDGWEVEREEGVELARQLGCNFWETSARSGEGVDEGFEGLLRGYKGGRLGVLREEERRKAREREVKVEEERRRREGVEAGCWRERRKSWGFVGRRRKTAGSVDVERML